MADRIPKCDTCKIGYGAKICYDCKGLFYVEDPVKKALEAYKEIDEFIKFIN